MAKEDDISCKICGHNATYLCETINLHSATRVLQHYRCRACGLVFIGNKITNEELGVAYGSVNHAAYYEMVKVETGKKFERSTQDLDKLISKDSKLIDLGTGNGAFLEMLLQQGYTQLAGHDIPGTDLQHLEAAGCKLYFDYDYQCIPSNHFDAVTLIDVAEHVLNPLTLFETCHRILKPGGFVYLHTPVVARLDKIMHLTNKIPGLKKLGKIWQHGRTSIFHQQNYSTKFLKLHLTQIGFGDFEIIKTNELSWPLSLYVQAYFTGKLRISSNYVPLLTAMFSPFLATNFFNSNKAIIWAKKL